MSKYQLAVVTKIEPYWTNNKLGEIIEVSTEPHGDYKNRDEERNWMVKYKYYNGAVSYTKNWRIDWVVLEKGKLLDLLVEVL